MGAGERFSVGALRHLAGAKTFERGEDYHLDGRVRIVTSDAAGVLAIVVGSEDYRTTLTGSGTAVGGDCTCLAFADRGFCKHMVAVGLAANAVALRGGTEDPDPSTRIMAYLKTRDVDTLARMILDLAERDTVLLSKLDLAEAASEPDVGKLEARLSAAIENAFHGPDYIDYRAARDWARGVDEVLDALETLAGGEHAAMVLGLAERVIEGVQDALGSMDDSDGHCGGLLERAGDIHLAAARVAKPDPTTLAADLFAREIADDYGVFGGAAHDYAEVLGEAGVAEYRRLAQEAWDALPARQGRRKTDGAAPGYRVLLGILDSFAEVGGDVPARIALRAKSLSDPWDYLGLATFCLEHGDAAEALRWAEEGLFVFEDDRPDQRLLVFAVDRLVAADRIGDAVAHLWRTFEKSPSLDIYIQLRKHADETLCERAIERLRGAAGKSAAGRWDHPADLLVRVLMHERRFDEAWAVVKAHGVGVGLREVLARATEATHPVEAIAVYAERVEALAGGVGGKPAYEEAAGLVRRMAALRGKAEQTLYIGDLKFRFARRRNFIALLP